MNGERRWTSVDYRHFPALAWKVMIWEPEAEVKIYAYSMRDGSLSFSPGNESIQYHQWQRCGNRVGVTAGYRKIQ